MMFDVVLWDVDGTLLDFLAAEKAAIKAMYAEYGFGTCTDEMVAEYSQINKRFWERLERGEVTRQQVLEGRFEEFFANHGADVSQAPRFNLEYQLRLGDTIVFCDDSLELLKSLKGHIPQYAVSNGTVAAQERKLSRSGLDQVFDGIFLSERVGAEKPDPAFFEHVLAPIGNPDPQRTLIVGDSLTSDIQGGVNAGIKTCWYNPRDLAAPGHLSIDWIISDLRQVPGILGL